MKKLQNTIFKRLFLLYPNVCMSSASHRGWKQILFPKRRVLFRIPQDGQNSETQFSLTILVSILIVTCQGDIIA
jgi:hypothetical protein